MINIHDAGRYESLISANTTAEQQSVNAALREAKTTISVEGQHLRVSAPAGTVYSLLRGAGIKATIKATIKPTIKERAG